MFRVKERKPEEWVKVHFCTLPTEHEPTAEWETAGHAERPSG